MKTSIIALALLFSVAVFAQEQKVDYKKTNDNLVEVTYYFADNSDVIERTGFFDEKGKLHGTWISYNQEGDRTVVANYKNGKKDGVWTYYRVDRKDIVTYKDNKIVSVAKEDIVIN